jgi:hypothetical protein
MEKFRTFNPQPKMKKLTGWIQAAGILTLTAQLQAQIPVGSHYPGGAEGIKGASLPPPGFYLRDYNYFLTSDKVNGVSGDVDLFAYVQAPRLIWMTNWKILGANYGMDIIVPFAYKEISAPFGGANNFNLSDIQVEPLLLSWHLTQFDVAAGYAIWMPTGNFDASTPAKYLTSPGSGYWTHMLTLGAVWYPDKEKTWAFSQLNRYEINTEQDTTDITPGNMFTADFSLSKTVMQGVDVGVSGYYQQLVTKDSGAHASSDYSHVVGIGPEISAFWPQIGLFSSLRYAYELDAKDRPQGQTVVLTLTKPF